MRAIQVLGIASAMVLAATAAGAQQKQAQPAQNAAAATCKLQAGDKKLAGAALTSFMKKCEGDATAACGKSADEKKLAGAARTSFTKKCIGDATGS